MALSKLDNVEIPKSSKRYVTIPDTDLFDQPHPAIRINQLSFGPGTHFLESEMANTVEERLKAYTRYNVRILQPKRDMESEALVNNNKGLATTGF